MSGPRPSDLDPVDLLRRIQEMDAIPGLTIEQIKEWTALLDDGETEGKRLTERMAEILSTSEVFHQLEKDPAFVAAMSELPGKLGFEPTRIVTLMKAMVGLTLAYLERG